MAKEALKFEQIDVDTLDDTQRDAFMAYLQAKSDFRTALQSAAPQGKRVVFTEKYGTIENPNQSVLKIAMVSAGQAKAKSVKSLADWMAERDQSGLAK